MFIKPFPKIENIHAIPISLQGYAGLLTANVYVVGSGPITLIDTGPKFPGSFEIVKKGLESAGFALEDVERIILTHGHIDHMGLAATIGEAAGHPVECHIHRQDQWLVSSAHLEKNMWGEEFDRLSAYVNMPRNELRKLKDRFSFFKMLCDPVDDPLPIEDGQEIRGKGYSLNIIHTPGHTPGSISLFETSSNILFTGDNVIKHITPNPLMQVRRDDLEDDEYRSLGAYLHSLDRLAELDVRFAFTGHGEYVEDLPGLISQYRGHHHDRMEAVWHALKKEPRPLYDLIDDIFPFVPDGDVFLAISEIMVHLELLLDEGRAELLDPGPPTLYRAL